MDANIRASNFNPDEAFFFIDSDNLGAVKSALYGWCIAGDTITDRVEALKDAELSGGGYVYVKRDGEKIEIRQDFTGCYGIYLYQDGDYFALSNSFLYLVDQIKTKRKITFNKRYAYHLIVTGLCSWVYSETMINEINMMDRSAVIELDIPQKALSWNLVDYKENTVDLDSPEGMQILDGWYRKWTGIVKGLVDSGEDVSFDLSGGLDSRMTLLLALGSGADLNKIHFASADDDLHCHPEDYEIASQMAEHFGFTLNNAGILSNDADNYSVENILNMNWYIQGCFHKENYFHYRHLKKSRYHFGGTGGESLRAYLHYKNGKAYINELTNAIPYYHLKNILKIRDSIESAMEKTLDEVNSKFKNFVRPFATFNDMASALFHETRNRNHFGKATVLGYYSNKFSLSPLLDADLARLKLCVSQDKNDMNALCTLLFERYCPKLLDFKIQGNRKFNETTIQNVRAVNRAFPYAAKPAEIRVRADMKSVRMNEIESVPADTPKTLQRNAFYSDEIKGEFLENYNKEAYDYILQDSKTRRYFPLKNVFPVLCICKILKDVSQPAESPCTPADFIIGCARTYTGVEPEVSKSLRDHELLDFFITARIDMKNSGSDENTIKLTEISDVTSINSPEWLNKNGNGYVIHSQTGTTRVAFRCVQGGTLDVWLRAMDVHYKDGSRIQIQVDYTKFSVNGETVFDTIHTASHDKPFRYSKKVSDGETVVIEMEWIPHDIRSEMNLNNPDRKIRIDDNQSLTEKELVQKLSWNRQKNGEYMDEIKSLKKRIDETAGLAARSDNENKRLRKELENVRASISFRVGRAITWLPRKMRRR